MATTWIPRMVWAVVVVVWASWRGRRLPRAMHSISMTRSRKGRSQPLHPEGVGRGHPPTP